MYEEGKIMNNQQIIDQYISSGQIIRNATLKGDYKMSNKEGMKLIRLFKLLEENELLADECLSILLVNENPVVASKAAAHCLALRIRVDEALKCLERVANNEDNGIFAFNADMTLKVWRDQGYLVVYQK